MYGQRYMHGYAIGRPAFFISDLLPGIISIFLACPFVLYPILFTIAFGEMAAIPEQRENQLIRWPKYKVGKIYQDQSNELIFMVKEVDHKMRQIKVIVSIDGITRETLYSFYKSDVEVTNPKTIKEFKLRILQ